MMWHGPLPKMAWYWFSPSTAKHREPPFFRQSNSSLRKYQQRGRWFRLPPTVPAFRICGVPTSSAACDERRIHLRDVGVGGELGERHRRADAEAASRRPPDRAIEVLDVDEPVRLRDVVLHQREQVHPAGQRQELAPLGAQRSDRFLLVRGVDVGKCLHRILRASSAFLSASWRAPAL